MSVFIEREYLWKFVVHYKTQMQFNRKTGTFEQIIYRQRDRVFAENRDSNPWPARITSITHNNKYRVKFYHPKHKERKNIIVEKVWPFDQLTVHRFIHEQSPKLLITSINIAKQQMLAEGNDDFSVEQIPRAEIKELADEIQREKQEADARQLTCSRTGIFIDLVDRPQSFCRRNHITQQQIGLFVIKEAPQELEESICLGVRSECEYNKGKEEEDEGVPESNARRPPSSEPAVCKVFRRKRRVIKRALEIMDGDHKKSVKLFFVLPDAIKISENKHQRGQQVSGKAIDEVLVENVKVRSQNPEMKAEVRQNWQEQEDEDQPSTDQTVTGNYTQKEMLPKDQTTNTPQIQRQQEVQAEPIPMAAETRSFQQAQDVSEHQILEGSEDLPLYGPPNLSDLSTAASFLSHSQSFQGLNHPYVAPVMLFGDIGDQSTRHSTNYLNQSMPQGSDISFSIFQQEAVKFDSQTNQDYLSDISSENLRGRL